jgi:hypothetical protein
LKTTNAIGATFANASAGTFVAVVQASVVLHAGVMVERPASQPDAEG